MEENTEKIRLRAEHLIDIERWREAVPLLSKALAANPHDARVCCLLSVCHYKLKDFKESLEFAERAIVSEPENEWGHRLRSVVLTATGKKADALKSAEEAVRLEPEEPHALQTLVYAYLNNGKTSEALEIAEKLRELYPETEMAFFMLGNVYLKNGSYREAERNFREALRINPNSSDSRNNLGVALLRQNQSKDVSILELSDEEEIHRHFVEAVKLEPNHETAAENLRNQFGYAHVLYLSLVLIPFYTCAFFIAPLMSIVTVLIVFIKTSKLLGEIRRRRKHLAPEMLMFLKSSGGRTFAGRLEEFKNFAGNFYRKTRRPHALAVVALVLYYWDSVAEPSETVAALSGVAGFVLIIVSVFWLQKEIVKD